MLLVLVLEQVLILVQLLAHVHINLLFLLQEN
jgi:hypothetical protein